MNTYCIDFYGIESYVDAETAGKARYAKFRELQSSDFDVTFEYFLRTSTCRKLCKTPPKKEVYSFKDSRGTLCVDCSECERGGNGDKSCSAGWRHAQGGKGSCFIGTLLEQK